GGGGGALDAPRRLVPAGGLRGVAPAEMIGEVVERPLAAVLDPGRQVTGQARLERAQLATQVIQVAGRVHIPDRTVGCGANPTVVATGEETVMSNMSEPEGQKARPAGDQ